MLIIEDLKRELKGPDAHVNNEPTPTVPSEDLKRELKVITTTGEGGL